MKLVVTSLFVLISFNVFATSSLCAKKSIVDKMNFKKLSENIEAHPVINTTLLENQLKIGQKITTKENEYYQIIFNQPYKVEFLIYPHSEIQILSKDFPCPQIKIKKGKFLSNGNHPTLKSCEFEAETEEAYIQPTGTSYLVETGALSDAIAELNGEAIEGSNLVGVGQTGTMELSSNEKYSVKKGTIQIKLKRISKNKSQNKIKYVKNSENKKNNSKKSLAKNSKSKIRFLAYNEKIKLKAGSSLSVKRKKSSKKTQTAELQVIDPSGI